MANRRIAKSSRLKQKKREKKSKKESVVKDDRAPKSLRQPTRGTLNCLRKERSTLLRRQAAERMVLKERLRDLMDRKSRLRRGDTAKVERRELSKYIRQLKEELRRKHRTALEEVDGSMELIKREQRASQGTRRKRLSGGEKGEDDWEDEDSNEEKQLNEEEIVQMFAHLTT